MNSYKYVGGQLVVCLLLFVFVVLRMDLLAYHALLITMKHCLRDIHLNNIRYILKCRVTLDRCHVFFGVPSVLND